MLLSLRKVLNELKLCKCFGNHVTGLGRGVVVDKL